MSGVKRLAVATSSLLPPRGGAAPAASTASRLFRRQRNCSAAEPGDEVCIGTKQPMIASAASTPLRCYTANAAENRTTTRGPSKSSSSSSGGRAGGSKHSAPAASRSKSPPPSAKASSERSGGGSRSSSSSKGSSSASRNTTQRNEKSRGAAAAAPSFNNAYDAKPADGAKRSRDGKKEMAEERSANYDSNKMEQQQRRSGGESARRQEEDGTVDPSASLPVRGQSGHATAVKNAAVAKPATAEKIRADAPAARAPTRNIASSTHSNLAAAAAAPTIDATLALWGSPALRTLLVASSAASGPPPRHYASVCRSTVVLRPLSGVPPAAAAKNSSSSCLRRSDDAEDYAEVDEFDDDDDDGIDHSDFDREMRGGSDAAEDADGLDADDVDDYDSPAAQMMALRARADLLAREEGEGTKKRCDADDDDGDEGADALSIQDKLVRDILAGAAGGKGNSKQAAGGSSGHGQRSLVLPATAGGPFPSHRGNDVTVTFHHTHHTRLLEIKGGSATAASPASADSSSPRGSVTPSAAATIPYASSAYLIYSEGGPATGELGAGSASAVTDEPLPLVGVETGSSSADGHRRFAVAEDNVSKERRLAEEDWADAAPHNSYLRELKQRERGGERTEAEGGEDTPVSASASAVSIVPSLPMGSLQTPLCTARGETSAAAAALRRIAADTASEEAQLLQKNLRPFLAVATPPVSMLPTDATSVSKDSNDHAAATVVGSAKDIEEEGETKTLKYPKAASLLGAAFSFAKTTHSNALDRHEAMAFSLEEAERLAALYPMHYCLTVDRNRNSNSNERHNNRNGRLNSSEEASSSRITKRVAVLDPSLVVIPAVPSTVRCAMVEASRAEAAETAAAVLREREARRYSRWGDDRGDGRYQSPSSSSSAAHAPVAFGLVESSSEAAVPLGLVARLQTSSLSSSPKSSLDDRSTSRSNNKHHGGITTNSEGLIYSTAASLPPTQKEGGGEVNHHRSLAFADKTRTFYVFRSAALRRRQREFDRFLAGAPANQRSALRAEGALPALRYEDAFAEVTLVPVAVAGLGHAIEGLVLAELSSATSGAAVSGASASALSASIEVAASDAADAILSAIFAPSSHAGGTGEAAPPQSSANDDDAKQQQQRHSSSAPPSPSLSAPATTHANALLDAVRAAVGADPTSANLAIRRRRDGGSSSSSYRDDDAGADVRSAPLRIRLPYISDVSLVGCETLGVYATTAASPPPLATPQQRRDVVDDSSSAPPMGIRLSLAAAVERTLALVAARQDAAIDALVRQRLGVAPLEKEAARNAEPLAAASISATSASGDSSLQSIPAAGDGDEGGAASTIDAEKALLLSGAAPLRRTMHFFFSAARSDAQTTAQQQQQSSVPASTLCLSAALAGDPLLSVNAPADFTSAVTLDDEGATLSSSSFTAQPQIRSVVVPSSSSFAAPSSSGSVVGCFAIVPRASGELFPMGLGRDFAYASPPSTMAVRMRSVEASSPSPAIADNKEGNATEEATAAVLRPISHFPSSPSVLCDVSGGAVFVGATCGRRVWWAGLMNRHTAVVPSSSPLTNNSGSSASSERAAAEERSALGVAMANAVAYGPAALRSVLRATTSPISAPFGGVDSSNAADTNNADLTSNSKEGGGGGGGPLAMFPLSQPAKEAVSQLASSRRRSNSSRALKKIPAAAVAVCGVSPIAVARHQRQRMRMYYDLLGMLLEGGEFARASCTSAVGAKSATVGSFGSLVSFENSLQTSHHQNNNFKGSSANVGEETVNLAQQQQRFFRLSPARHVLSSAYGDLAFTADSGADGDLSVAGNVTNTASGRRVGVMRLMEGAFAEAYAAEKRRALLEEAPKEGEGEAEEEERAATQKKEAKFEARSSAIASHPPLVIREAADVMTAVERAIPIPTSSSSSSSSSSSFYPHADTALFPTLLESGNALKRRLLDEESSRSRLSTPSSASSPSPSLAEAFAEAVLSGRRAQREPLSETFGAVTDDLAFGRPNFGREVRQSVAAVVAELEASENSAGNKKVATTSSAGASKTVDAARPSRREDEHKVSATHQQQRPPTTGRAPHQMEQPQYSPAFNKKIDIFVMLLKKWFSEQQQQQQQQGADDKEEPTLTSLVGAVERACRQRGIDTARFVEMSIAEVSQMALAAVRGVGSGGSSAADAAAKALAGLHTALSAAMKR